MAARSLPTRVRELQRALRARLMEERVEADAEPMRAYMKSEMPFAGVKTPVRRALAKALFAEHPLEGRAELESAVRGLWSGARYREERHAAIDLLGSRSYKALRTTALLPLYEELVVDGAWWDLVDAMATQQFVDLYGASGSREEERMARAMRRWARSKNEWVRRAAIVSQIKRKAATERALFAECVERSLPADAKPLHGSFWITKAIGWALREHAKHEPEWVLAFVREHRAALAKLSLREALKNLGGLAALEESAC